MDNKEFDKNLRIIAKSSIILFIGLIISKIFNYAFRILVARYYGPEVYGLLSISLMVSGWFVVFSLMGLGEGVVRYLSFYRAEPKKIKQVFIFSITLVSISSILSGILLFFTSPLIATKIFHNSNLIIFLKIFSITIPLFSISQILLGTMKSFEKVSQYSFIINILNPSLRLITLILLMLFGANSSLISLSVVIAYTGLLIASYLFCKKIIFILFIKEKTRRDKTLNKELFAYSLPLMFAAFVASLFGWADIFVIGLLKGATEVGLYDSALPIAMLLTLPSFLFVQLFFPIINKEFSKGNYELIIQLSKQIGKWIFVLNLPILFFTIFFPGTLINLLFGQEFLSASIPLIFLSIGFFIYAQSEVSLNLLGMLKKSKTRFFNLFLALLLDIILNFLLIPKEIILGLNNSKGIVGASIATMFSYLFYASLTFLQTYHYFKIIPLKRKMFGVLFSAILSGIVTFYLKGLLELNLFSIIFLGIFFYIFYFVLILLTKSLDKSDISVLNSIIKKLTFNYANH